MRFHADHVCYQRALTHDLFFTDHRFFHFMHVIDEVGFQMMQEQQKLMVDFPARFFLFPFECTPFYSANLSQPAWIPHARSYSAGVSEHSH